MSSKLLELAELLINKWISQLRYKHFEHKKRTAQSLKYQALPLAILEITFDVFYL